MDLGEDCLEKIIKNGVSWFSENTEFCVVKEKGGIIYGIGMMRVHSQIENRSRDDSHLNNFRSYLNNQSITNRLPSAGHLVFATSQHVLSPLRSRAFLLSSSLVPCKSR